MRWRRIAMAGCATTAAVLLAAGHLPTNQKAVRAPHAAVSEATQQLPEGSFRHGEEPMRGPTASNVSHSYRVRLAQSRARVEANPVDTAALATVATLLHSAHEAPEAIEYYERYLAQGGRRRDVLLEMAGACVYAKRWEAAERAMLALLDTSPDDSEAMYNLGAIRANQGDYEAARHWWERVRDRPEANVQLAAKAAASLQRLPPTGS